MSSTTLINILPFAIVIIGGIVLSFFAVRSHKCCPRCQHRLRRIDPAEAWGPVYFWRCVHCDHME
jgi:hypothetical protein